MTPQAPLTGSGCREHFYGGFGGCQFVLTYSPLGARSAVAGEEARRLAKAGCNAPSSGLSCQRVRVAYTQTEYPLAELVHFPWPYGSEIRSASILEVYFEGKL